MNMHYRFSNIDQIKEELSETISRNDLKKKILNSLESFSGKVVNVKFEKHLKECFPELHIYLSENLMKTEKTLSFTLWHGEKRTYDKVSIILVSKDYSETDWPSFNWSEAVSRNGLAGVDAWIEKTSERLVSGHWERYFQAQKQVKEMYDLCKEMEN